MWYLDQCWRWCDMAVLISLAVPMISPGYHTSCTSLVSVFLGDNGDWRGWHPRVTLISSHLPPVSASRHSPTPWKAAAVHDIQHLELISTIHPQDILWYLSIFQMSISCALHYIWQCPTHPPVPHILISMLIWELESWLLRSSWGDYCQSHIEFQLPLSRCEHTKSSIFLFSTPCFVIEMQRVRWSVCSGHMFSVLILMRWIPIVQVSTWPMRRQHFWSMDQSEPGRVWRCWDVSEHILTAQ